MPRLHQVLKGVQTEHSKQGRVARSRLPITPAVLRKVAKTGMDKKDSNRIPFNNIMLWGACLVTFFSFCHSREITLGKENHYDASIHSSYSDLAVDNPTNPSVILMLIKKSKTNQGQRGVKIYLGKTGDSFAL